MHGLSVDDGTEGVGVVAADIAGWIVPSIAAFLVVCGDGRGHSSDEEATKDGEKVSHQLHGCWYGCLGDKLMIQSVVVVERERKMRSNDTN